jgi:ATP-dependent Clp protease adaptor protein ClpS|tara:strand:- start:439 stop:714 length:276 start_codon:yes stop_codon:yes gene_type:complete
MKFETEIEELLEVEVKEQKSNILVLFNDDVNTFDFVMNSLVEVCDHDALQAEQAAILVHYKGKCDVKNGDKKKLLPLCNALLKRGLTAEIH